jgi:hypothetical protein
MQQWSPLENCLKESSIAASRLSRFNWGDLYVLAYFTLVWFQVVKGATPLDSGLYILPTVISQIIVAAVSGMLSVQDFQADTTRANNMKLVGLDIICHWPFWEVFWLQ